MDLVVLLFVDQEKLPEVSAFAVMLLQVSRVALLMVVGLLFGVILSQACWKLVGRLWRRYARYRRCNEYQSLFNDGFDEFINLKNYLDKLVVFLLVCWFAYYVRLTCISALRFETLYPGQVIFCLSVSALCSTVMVAVLLMGGRLVPGTVEKMQTLIARHEQGMNEFRHDSAALDDDRAVINTEDGGVSFLIIR